MATPTVLVHGSFHPVPSVRAVSLEGRNGLERRPVVFTWCPDAFAWVSGPVAAARRAPRGKWFDRWLIVRGEDLRGGRLELCSDAMGDPAIIERWADAVPARQRSEIDNDGTYLDTAALRRREVALATLGRELVRTTPLDASCGYAELCARERGLRRRTVAFRSDTEADLWRFAAGDGLVTEAETNIAYLISSRVTPGRWGYAGD